MIIIITFSIITNFKTDRYLNNFQEHLSGLLRLRKYQMSLQNLTKNYSNELSHFLLNFSAGIFQAHLKTSLTESILSSDLRCLNGPFYSFQKYKQKLPFCHAFLTSRKIITEDFNCHQFFFHK